MGIGEWLLIGAVGACVVIGLGCFSIFLGCEAERKACTAEREQCQGIEERLTRMLADFRRALEDE